MAERYHLHAIKGVDARDDVGTVPANQKADTVVEGLESALASGDLGFLDDV